LDFVAEEEAGGEVGDEEIPTVAIGGEKKRCRGRCGRRRWERRLRLIEVGVGGRKRMPAPLR